MKQKNKTGINIIRKFKTKMIEMNPKSRVITNNVNGLNSPVKRQRLSE